MLEILTDDELFELTGYRRPAYQLRWLSENGIHHWRRKDGIPVVLRTALGGAAIDVREKPEGQPDG